MSQPNNGYPPEQLIQKWCREASSAEDIIKAVADWQLNRCCEELRLIEGECACDELRAICRPKPLSLKQQGLEALNSARYQPNTDFKRIDPDRADIIRRALESIPGD
jgi:hypothetical protein